MTTVETVVLVREASLSDIPACVVLILALRGCTIWRTVDFVPNERHIATVLRDAILGLTPRHVLVGEVDGEIVGLCVGEVVTHLFIPDVPYLMEWALYVTPEHRTSRQWLWREMCRWGKAHGAVGGVYGKPMETHATWGSEEMIWRHW